MKHGNNIEYYRNGTKKTETNYVDGKKHGKWIRWGEDGTLVFDINYINVNVV